MGKHPKILDLPVLAARQEILSVVGSSSVTILSAQTGAGKSTQVPQFLMEHGYRVVCTQTRRLATRTLSQRVADERGTRLGDLVGYHTAEERVASAATEILYCTDGLQLVRELAGQGGTGHKTVLVLDEVHEWNLNIEVLCAWARQRIEAGDDLKVVLMSATLDAEGLSSFFGGAPIISVPGRLFPVERRHASARALIDQSVELAKAGRNVLVFQPGKKEIAETISTLQARLGSAALVLPLHGELDPSEQQRCFDSAPDGKVKVVVATNVAQTSVTIPDIDAVVDSGLERRIELRDGIEGLYLLPISQADCAQRAGRAGRTKEGVYVLCSDTSEGERPAFPRAEVLRSRLDQMVLRLAVQGFDATALKFFHQPDETVLADGKRALVALGAMSADGSVTPIGRRMAKFPVSVGFSRMLIEAERLGVVEQVATIAACLEAGDIRARDGAWRSLTQERRSDLLAMLDVYNAGKAVKGGGGKSKADALRNAGIFAKDYFRADEIRRKLLDAVGGRIRSSSKRFASQDEERQAILRACVAGMVDHLYRETGYGRYINGGRGERELARESVLAGTSPKWVVGLPFDVSGKDRRGRTFVLNLVGAATAVDPTWLVEVAPHLASLTAGLRPTYSAEKDLVTSVTETFFNGQKVGEEAVADWEHPEAAKVFARWLASQTSAAGTHLDAVLRSNAERQEQARQLNTRTGEETFKVFSSDEVFERFVPVLSGARRIVEVVETAALKLPALDTKAVEQVERDNPATISLLGETRTIEYRARDYYSRQVPAPRIALKGEQLVQAQNAWQQLPDEVRLPGGRLVEVAISFGYYITITGTSGDQVRAQVRQHLNRAAWERWSKPALSLPNVAAGESLPEITTAEYGKCVVTGEPLLAFGAIGLNRSRYYSTDPLLAGSWHLSREEADKVRAEALARLESMLREERERAELEAARAEAEEAKRGLSDLEYSAEYREVRDEVVRRKVSDRRYAYPPSELAELRLCTAQTKAIIAEVQSFTAASKAAKAAAEHDKQVALFRRAEVEAEIASLPYARVFVLIREDGTGAVNAGKPSKLGRFEARPSLGDAFGAEGLPHEPKATMWLPVPVGQKVVLRDYSARGNLNGEDAFTIPAGLTPGVWSVGEEMGGWSVAYHVTYVEDGRNLIPTEVNVVRYDAKSCRPTTPLAPTAKVEPKAEPISTEDALAALKAAGFSVQKKKPKK